MILCPHAFCNALHCICKRSGPRVIRSGLSDYKPLLRARLIAELPLCAESILRLGWTLLGTTLGYCPA